ncbi:HAD family hydrolase [Nitrososphaera viennensis]|uniref:Phosphatase of the haloacid dehalogenase (HAD)-like hydrolase family n=2 Tax=Nitrososphaera viennensis TaxID=1034015 RepID=A0A060HJP6_9ARCH|nr:HAD family hydrolase [Nitrososphaera viennensis]AIC15485.1 phosphatase of the haloacid dehalogenase (HAD)-like hydrolase family [Nitrososphaera viennensis EN76]UVS70374.1 HAD family hydrolase [Nitrososphaera viennensis]
MSKQPFVFFDLGQTLVTEWDFINHFDGKFLELLNGYGARIDMRNYRAVRDNIIRDRRIGNGSVRELVIEICRAILPSGYENAIVRRIDPEVKAGRKELFRFADGAEQVVKELSQNKKCDLGIIANQSEDIVSLLQGAGLDKYFKVTAISGAVRMKKPDPRIFQLALKEAGREAQECIMVGDRLDTDVCPANRLGMATIRVTDSLFALQEPREDCERPAYTIAKLTEVPATVEKIISRK